MQVTPELRADPDHFPLSPRTTLLYFVGSLRVREDGTDGDPEYSAGARQVKSMWRTCSNHIIEIRQLIFPFHSSARCECGAAQH